MYWVVDYKSDSKGRYHPVVIGGRSFYTNTQAQNYIDTANLSNRAEIFAPPEISDTTSMDRVTQEIKAILIKRYRSLDQGMVRAVHR